MMNKTLPKPDISLDQDDGAVWSVYNDPSDVRGFTILTSGGNVLMQEQNGDPIRSLIRQYRAAEIGSTALGNLHLLGEDPEIRRELGQGKEATVYSMGPYAVREVSGITDFHPALGELQRMDAINMVIESGLPRWLNLPAHYALHVDPRTQKTYTLMDRVNGGLTAEHVRDYPDIPADKKEAFDREIGKTGLDTEAAKEHVQDLYDSTYEVLAEAIRKSGRDPRNYLTDWELRNALIEGLQTPVAGSKFRLSVIDQYKA